MKYLKYAGLCAAGFFTEYLLSVVFSAFVTLLVLYPPQLFHAVYCQENYMCFILKGYVMSLACRWWCTV